MLKRIATIASLMLITLGSHAQSYNGKYLKMTTEHYKDGQQTGQTIKFKPGTLIIEDRILKIDEDVYTILKKDAPEEQDEHFWAQSMVIVTKGKTGTYKVMDCVIELKPDKKTVDYVQLNKTKSTRIGYTLD